jgi:hypothetical protein
MHGQQNIQFASRLVSDEHILNENCITLVSLYEYLSLKAFAAIKFNEIVGQTGSEGLPTFQELTPFPSSGCAEGGDGLSTEIICPRKCH